MASKVLDLLTVCGLDEIAGHGAANVSHVLSILDPGTPEPDFAGYPQPLQRTTLRFHDIVGPYEGMVAPTPAHLEAVLAFGAGLDDGTPPEGHLLVHCHMGISRSTAAMVTLLAQAHPAWPEEEVVARVADLRSVAWPNLLMIEHADALLGRGGRLREAVARLYLRRLVARPELAGSLQRIGRDRELEAARAVDTAGSLAVL